MSAFPTSVAARPSLAPEPWGLRDPALFLRQLDDLLPHPAVSAALVHRPAAAQELQAAVAVEIPPSSPAQDVWELEADASAMSDLLRVAAERLWGGADVRRSRPEHAFVTVVRRTGRVVFNRSDRQLQIAWLFANHALPVFSGDLILLTPHGWRCDLDDSCGATPRLHAPTGDET